MEHSGSPSQAGGGGGGGHHQQAAGAPQAGGGHGGGGGGGMAGPGPGGRPKVKVDWGRLFSEGFGLLSLVPGKVAFYALMFLLNGICAIFVAQFWGNLTGSYSHADANGPKVDHTVLYITWAVLALLVIAFNLPQTYLQSTMDLHMSNVLRCRIFDKVLKQDPEFFREYDPGRLNVLVNTMTLQTQMLLRQLLLDPPLQLILFGFTSYQLVLNFNRLSSSGSATIFGIPITFLLAGVILIVALIPPLLISRVTAGMLVQGRETQGMQIALSSLVTSIAQAPEEIQLMGAQKFFGDKHGSTLEAALKIIVKYKLTVGMLNIVSMLPNYIIQVLFIGLALILQMAPGSNPSVGSIVAILSLAPLIISPINTISSCLVSVSQSYPSAESVFNVLDKKSRSDVSVPGDDFTITDTSIEARNVNFSYSPNLPPVFTDMNVSIPGGVRTAFIAEMGQGKTTFFRLVLRFYDPQGGEISIGGRPTHSFSHASIRRQVAMMSQFPSFFHASLRENMLIAKPTATDEELMYHLERTGMNLIMQQRGIKLDTPLNSGQILSGGQKKLLALSRCLLRDPAIIMLDEPTTGVDNIEKFKLLEKLRVATEGKTVLVVDHDINWLLQFCDNFIGMGKGRVLEHGDLEHILTHPNLIHNLFTIAQGPRIQEISKCLAKSH